MAEFMNFKGDYNGLSSENAEKNLRLYGENRFFETDDKSYKPYQIVLHPAVIILTVCTLCELFIVQDVAAGIACAILDILSAVLLARVYRDCNERIDERTAAAKMKYRVIRDSELSLISSEYLVQDDIIILQSGEIVPADVHILETSGISADESEFTGDITPRPKRSGQDTANTTLKETCMYAGSRVVSGSAVARVTAIGEDTYKARSGEWRTRPDPNYSSYEKACQNVTLPLTVAALVICAASFLFSLFNAGKEPAQLAMQAAGLLLLLIPPFAGLFVRIYNVQAISKIKKKSAAVKNLGVLEKLNALTTVVIDKSIVVAPNMLEVAGIYSQNRSLMITVTVLACETEDTMLTEQAFLLSAALGGSDIKEIRSNELIAQYHYNDNDRIGGNIYRVGGRNLLCVKGSVDKITGLCDMDTDTLFELQRRVAELEKHGHEVWASAYNILDDNDIPKSLYSVKYTYMGLVSFMSATRDIIPLAIQGCRRAGVKLVLTSSDSPETALAMGKKIGLNPAGMITGSEIRENLLLGKKTDFGEAEIFGGVTAAQKIEIIDNLRAAGATVAAIGHTDADYQILKHCDLGVTSLENTVGCIYDASGLIVSDDNFSSIVEIIKEVRLLHRNIKKCLALCIASMMAFFLTALADVLFSVGVITPMFAGLFAAVIIPVAVMSFSGSTADAKSEMSASGFIGRGVMDKRFFIDALISGAITGILSAVCTVICGGLMTAAQVSSVIFIQLTVSFCATAVSMSGRSVSLPRLIKNKGIPKKTMLSLVLTAVTALILVYIPFVNGAFGFAAPHIVAALVAVILGFCAMGCEEIKKQL